MIFDDLQSGMVVTVGIPFDENSSFMRGAAGAPVRIREMLYSGSANLCSESGVDLGNEPRFRDLGDLKIGTGLEAIQDIEADIAALLNRDVRVLALGGDHAITYPIMKAYARKYGELTILQLDAHPDLYDAYDGNRYSHGSPFARIMEDGLAKRLVQVGIRAMTPDQRQQVERFGVEVIEMNNWPRVLVTKWEGPIYLSVDLDVIDPACVPGVSHHEPGGPSTRHVIHLIQEVPVPIVGADIVEFNPVRDVSNMTAMVAVKLLKEIAAGMLDTNKS
jgi:agmatinase